MKINFNLNNIWSFFNIEKSNMPIPDYIKNIIIKNDPSVKKISLSNLGIDDADTEELFDLLSKNQYINSINLSYNNICTTLPKSLTQLQNLEELDLSQNNLGDEGVICFSDNYTSFNLKKLNLRENGITDKSINAINKLILNGVDIDINDQPSNFLNKPKSTIEKNIPSKLSCLLEQTQGLSFFSTSINNSIYNLKKYLNENEENELIIKHKESKEITLLIEESQNLVSEIKELNSKTRGLSAFFRNSDDLKQLLLACELRKEEILTSKGTLM